MKINDRRYLTTVQTAFIMAVLTLGSKFLGFIREMVLAGFYGTSYIVDAYVMSQSIPSILFAGIFGAIATAYMPLLSNKIEKEGGNTPDIFTSQIINVLLIISAISSLVGLLISEQIVDIFAHGFKDETREITIFFVRVTFSYTLFTAISDILDAYLQYSKIFIPQIIIGYTQSACIIITIIISTYTSEYYLVFGALFAYVLRFFLMSIITKKYGFNYTLNNKGIRNTAKQITAMAFPVFLGSTIYQINLFLDKYLASGLPEGSVSALNYSNLLNNMVFSLTIMILTTMIYPRFTQACAVNDIKYFNNLLQRGVNLIFIIALPFSIGAMFYSEQIVQIVYERGAFDINATILTREPYFYYSAGMIFLSLNVILTRVYYAMKDSKMPMIFATICVIINIMLNLFLIEPMAHGGLALATSISSMINTILLFWGLKRYYKQIVPIGNVLALVKIIISSIVSICISFVAYKCVILKIAAVIYMRTAQVGLAITLAIILYLVFLKLLNINEFNLIKQLFYFN